MLALIESILRDSEPSLAEQPLRLLGDFTPKDGLKVLICFTAARLLRCFGPWAWQETEDSRERNILLWAALPGI